MKDLPASIVNSPLVTDPWEGVELKIAIAEGVWFWDISDGKWSYLGPIWKPYQLCVDQE